MNGGPLKAMVLEYQRSGQGLPAILGRLALRIYRYPLQHRSHDEDDCGEFYLFFYPRLLRCLVRFRDQGKPFEWYLNAVLRWHWRAYCRRRQLERTGWALAGKPELWDSCVEPEPEDSRDTPAVCRLHLWRQQAGNLGLALDSRQSGRADRRRLLLVALKNAHRLPDDSLGPLSLLTGVPEAWLAAVVDRLRQRLFARQVRLHALYARRNRIFSDLLREEQALLWEAEPQRRADLLLRVEALRERLQRSQGRIRRVLLCPTNREIAALTRIPKGSVDTSIYWLRRRLAVRRGPAETAPRVEAQPEMAPGAGAAAGPETAAELSA
jgi:hypothetical protein